VGLDVPEPNQEEISFGELFHLLRRSKWLATGITALFTIAAITAVLIVPKRYEATLVLSAVSSNSENGLMGNLSSAASQFSGLAAMVGISPQADSKKSESLAVLQSEALTEEYIKANNLLPVLYPKKWDASKNGWKGTDVRKNPTLWKANSLFRDDIRSLTTDTKTGLSTLAITWADPVTAARWANDLVKMTNDYLRDKAIRESESNIAYLNDQASKTDVVGVKQAIFTILQSQISKAMLARGSEEYALKVIDPAFAPERPSSPKPVLWVGIGFVAGLMFSIVIITLRKPPPLR
jgi:uncharacterized protein involved in exopolysaccharide biosynthesis